MSDLNITILSSAVFTNVVFPVLILNKINGLEKVIFEKNARFFYEKCSISICLSNVS